MVYYFHYLELVMYLREREREIRERERVICTLARGARAGGHDEEATA
jgi:hypothetical protein